MTTRSQLDHEAKIISVIADLYSSGKRASYPAITNHRFVMLPCYDLRMLESAIWNLCHERIIERTSDGQYIIA